jgi:maltose O-acetyltransferase
VLIGRNVFIGARSTVLKGVEIGDNSVVGAGSVVSSDVPPNVIAAGNPCVVIRTLEAAPEEATSTGRQP